MRLIFRLSIGELRKYDKSIVFVAVGLIMGAGKRADYWVDLWVGFDRVIQPRNHEENSLDQGAVARKRLQPGRGMKRKVAG